MLLLASAENHPFFLSRRPSLGWAPAGTVQQYYSFVTRFTIGFGLAFELPVVVLVPVRFGLSPTLHGPHQALRRRPIFVLATIITPMPNLLTLIAMRLRWFALRELYLDRLDHEAQGSENGMRDYLKHSALSNKA